MDVSVILELVNVSAIHELIHELVSVSVIPHDPRGASARSTSGERLRDPRVGERQRDP